MTTSKQERAERPAAHVVIRTTDEIARTLTYGEEFSHQIALAGAAQYPTADLPVDPYVLGYWLGDGTSTKGEITVGAVTRRYWFRSRRRATRRGEPPPLRVPPGRGDAPPES